jgi:SAM-dependent methyltransferase
MPDDLLAWLASLPPAARDAALEHRLGITEHGAHDSPGEDMIGYHASGVAPIVRALMEAPVRPTDTFIDLGAGLGKAVFLARLLTGATARGVEVQSTLVERARERAAARGIDVTFACTDARHADIHDGTVFFLYTPCTGPAMDAVLDRLRAVAAQRAIVVCALGFDAHRRAPWLVPRPLDAFWLTVYDAALPGVPRRPAHPSAISGAAASAVALERAMPRG